MLTNAAPVFVSVPAVFIDPFSLAASQMEGMCGYLAVAYSGRRVMCDLLFLSGRTIQRAGRLSAESRVLVSDEEVRERSAASRSEPGTTVSLFQADREVVGRFAATFAVEPALKLLLGTLTRRQVHDLVVRSGCRHGILEFFDVSVSPPRIHQVEFTAGHAFPETPRGFRSGRLFLYDISSPALRKPRLPLAPSGKPLPFAGVPPAPGAAPQAPPSQPAARKTAASDPSAPLRAPRTEPAALSGADLPLFRVAAGPSADAAAVVAAGPEGEAARRQPPQPEFSRPFERLYRAFRTIAADQVGARSEEMFAGALRHAQRTRPGFDPASVAPDDVPLLLGMFEAVAADVPLLKRGRFRSAARGVLAEFYDRNYELLERHRVLDPVQALYSKLSS